MVAGLRAERLDIRRAVMGTTAEACIDRPRAFRSHIETIDGRGRALDAHDALSRLADRALTTHGGGRRLTFGGLGLTLLA